MPLHPLTNFETQKYLQNENKFIDVYSWNNWAKVKEGTYVIILDEYESIWTHWMALYLKDNNRRASYNAIYFYNFGDEHILKKIKKFICNKNIITNSYIIQA